MHFILFVVVNSQQLYHIPIISEFTTKAACELAAKKVLEENGFFMNVSKAKCFSVAEEKDK